MAKKKAKGGMTKAEAVRKAIGDLGPEAKPAQLQGHIKTKYGIDMTAGHVKVERQKYFKKEGAAEPTVQPSAASKTEPKKAPAAGMSKREAVKRALADLGRHATPSQLQPHIREKFDIEMTTDHISTEKGNILRKARGARQATAKPTTPKPLAVQKSAARTAEPNEAAPEPVVPPQANGDGIGLDDIEATKGLMERVGPDRLKKLIDVLAR